MRRLNEGLSMRGWSVILILTGLFIIGLGVTLLVSILWSK